MNGGFKMFFGVAVGIVLFGLTSSLAWADGWPGSRGGGGHAFGMARHGMSGHGGTTSHVLRHLLRHQKDIGLTDEQTAKLKALALDQDRARIRMHADVQVAERELRALVADEKTDLSVIQAKLKEREALEANLRFMGIKAKRDLFAVLTPEQRDKLKVIREQMRESYRARMLRSEGLAKADHEETAEGMPPTLEAEPHEARGGLQAS
ncbi:MAG: Spy/CpxP family protein refolding chaperone [bacterium]